MKTTEGLVRPEDSPGSARGGRTSSGRTASELIRYAKEHPPEPIIRDLLNMGEILLLHGSEDSFKSFFVLQMAESIALGHPLLGSWRVPTARTVGVIETELHETMLGERLARMFPQGDPPANLRFFREDALRDWRRLDLERKFEVVQKWIHEEQIDVLMIDTANDFFRGTDNPSQENVVGGFFDRLRNLDVGARVIVRHDRKKNGEGSSNEQIRGSAEWKEDPEAIISLERRDRRTNEVELEVGKLRYGQKPEPLTLWFDAGAFRLTALPPVIAVVRRERQTRKQILDACEERFGLGARIVDDMLAKERDFLGEYQDGHEKSFEIDLRSVSDAPWLRFCVGEVGEA